MRALLACVALLSATWIETESRWEENIASFEKQDQEQTPPEKAVLFVGSSSIRLWNLDESFPQWTTINRGFGGSEVSDLIEFADRIIVPYRPSRIFVYAGDNDISREKTAEQVAQDYQDLIAKIRPELPTTPIHFIAIKPSIKRWALVGEMRKANRLIREYCERNPQLYFVDIDAPMLGNDGKPRSDLFVDDGLHLNAAGYRLWTQVIQAHLKAG